MSTERKLENFFRRYISNYLEKIIDYFFGISISGKTIVNFDRSFYGKPTSWIQFNFFIVTECPHQEHFWLRQFVDTRHPSEMRLSSSELLELPWEVSEDLFPLSLHLSLEPWQSLQLSREQIVQR